MKHPLEVTDPSQKWKIGLFITALVLGVMWGLKVLELLSIIANAK